MSMGDRMKMGDNFGISLGPADAKVQEHCTHEGHIAGEKCEKCGRDVPCPQCGAAGNIGENGCMNCGWSAVKVNDIKVETDISPPEEKK